MPSCAAPHHSSTILGRSSGDRFRDKQPDPAGNKRTRLISPRGRCVCGGTTSGGGGDRFWCQFRTFVGGGRGCHKGRWCRCLRAGSLCVVFCLSPLPPVCPQPGPQPPREPVLPWSTRDRGGPGDIYTLSIETKNASFYTVNQQYSLLPMYTNTVVYTVKQQ